MDKDKFIPKQITIRKDQVPIIVNRDLNLSRFVQRKLDELGAK